MSELFSQRSSVEGKIPSGLFNASFDLDSGSWAQDAPATKCLAMDGYFISLFDLRLDRRPLALADHVLRDVPAAWDPSAIARFIEKYGTHVIVGLSMGGQDVVCVKQDRSSPLSPSEIKEHLDRLGDQLFTGACPVPPLHCKSKDKFKIPEAFNVFDAQVAQQRLQAGITTLVSSKEGVTVIYSKRGGDTTVGSHSEWLLTVPATPDVINVKAVPITSLIRGVAGAGYLSHAINLYLRYKPPVADLKYFLDFQHHKMWAPVLGELPLGPCSHRQGTSPALHFSLLGSKLYVSSSEVIVPTLPVTGMRLHLEGKKNNRRPPAAPVGHPDVHRGAGRQAAGVARVGGGLRRPVLRAGPVAVADVRARLHRAGQVRTPVVRRPPGGLHRDRRAAPRRGARLHRRAPPQAALLRAPRLRRRAVQVGARHDEAVGEVQLPVRVLRWVFRWRRWHSEGQAAARFASGRQHRLRCARRRASGACRGAEDAQVRGHLAGDHGAAGQPRVLAHHRCEARRRQGEDLAARKVLPAYPGFLTTC
ncbi:MACPF domain-containing protein At1g14780-like isoform X3 [Phragmites australis]|nr:MACPF domain-containing protein At1g14780-like isoform X3 [Phragmites australis]